MDANLGWEVPGDTLVVQVHEVQSSDDFEVADEQEGAAKNGTNTVWRWEAVWEEQANETSVPLGYFLSRTPRCQLDWEVTSLGRSEA